MGLAWGPAEGGRVSGLAWGPAARQVCTTEHGWGGECKPGRKLWAAGLARQTASGKACRSPASSVSGPGTAVSHRGPLELVAAEGGQLGHLGQLR